MPNGLHAQSLQWLRTALANPSADFRPGQWEAIECLVGQRQRVLVVQRTGWGKSLVYFIATRLLRSQGLGPTLLISPLLSLMRNQLLAASRLGLRAATVNSSNEPEWPQVRDSLLSGRTDLLLISPERLGNEAFTNDVLLPMASGVGLFVVDEAHCISDWGHDFRPDYRRIARVLGLLPRNTPVLATTATANQRVIEDVRCQLGDLLQVIRGPLARESLRLQNLVIPNAAWRLAWLAEHLPELEGAGIIYALTVRDADLVAHWLENQGIQARAYHASLNDAVRVDLENQLLGSTGRPGELKALVATSALGMGFDKPDLGFVVHYQTPQSAIHYYQQVGRAGRSLERATVVLLSGEEDCDIIHYFIQAAFPPEEHAAAIVEAVEQRPEGLTLAQLCQQLNVRRGRLESALKLLTVADQPPLYRSGSRYHRSQHPYRYDRERVEAVTARREQEWSEMQSYLRHRGCLMEFLLRALDDPSPRPCTVCSPCSGRPVVSETATDELAQEALRFLRRSFMLLTTPVQCPPDAFPAYGFSGRLGADLRPVEGRTLSRWSDSAWGRLVREGKASGIFSNELVEAAARLVEEEWRPDPRPTWVACIPSRATPDLVPDFARRLAARLALPFSDCVQKVRDTAPQKDMQNRFHQANNLDGAFAVHPERLYPGPVLLVDDMVDSGWTFTVASALLRRAGVSAVYPLALASTAVSD